MLTNIPADELGELLFDDGLRVAELAVVHQRLDELPFRELALSAHVVLNASLAVSSHGRFRSIDVDDIKNKTCELENRKDEIADKLTNIED